jgi:cytochrome c553
MTPKRWVQLGLVMVLTPVIGLSVLGAIRPLLLAGLVIGHMEGVHEPPAPPLAARDPGAIRRAAVHYDLVCAACHASPARPDQGEHLDYHPPAPKLHERLRHWPPELLFATVRDGIRHSAMPAWPAPERSDEIWAMVAFLERLPDMDAVIYRKLAATGIEAPLDAPAPARTCLRCHGGPDPAGPRLDLQDPAYISATLSAFRAGNRKSGYMQVIAAPLDDAAIADLATYFATQRAPLAATEGGPTPSPLALTGDATRKIGACVACHGPPGPAQVHIPVLAGQHPSYLAAQLHRFADAERHRGGGPLVSLMERSAAGLTPDEIVTLSEWYASLGTLPDR